MRRHTSTVIVLTVPSHETVWALRQNLEGVFCGTRHYGEHSINEFKRNALVEQIAHGIDKDHSRRAPSKRQIEALRMQGNVSKLAAAEALG